MKTLHQQAEELTSYFDRLYEFLGQGTWRRTYSLGDGRVAKIPRLDGEDSLETCCQENIAEAESFEAGKVLNDKWQGYKFNRYFLECDLPCPLAKCHLVWFLDVPVVVMEEVVFLHRLCETQRRDAQTQCIDWSYLCDGGQVGLAKDGRVVAYDYNRM